MVDVRDATPDDRRAVRDVHVASVRVLGPAAYDEAQVAAWVGDEDRDPREYSVDGEDVEFLVAVDDASSHREEGPVVGFGELRVGEPDGYDVAAEAEIRAMYVAPERAGEGVGTAVLHELEARGVGTNVLTASLNAVPFYEGHGYERLRETTHEFGGEVPGTVVEMRKRL